MTPPDDLPVLSFAGAEAMGRWLADHHADAAGFWLMVPKKGRSMEGPTYAQALDEALCFGWIDSQKVKYDENYYLQRFTPRTARSKWSKINRKKIEALVAAGRMEEAGLAQVQKAKEDGRWEAAYDSPSTATVPADLQRALETDPAALAFFESLSSANRFAILYRIHEAKRPATRERRIAKYVEMCSRGETLQ
jgi:uncharacterized protein YdeI (YjbR/CyaY-like superfamily)